MLKQIVLSLFIFSVFFGCADRQQPILKAVVPPTEVPTEIPTEVPTEVTEVPTEVPTEPQTEVVDYESLPLIDTKIINTDILEPGLYRMKAFPRVVTEYENHVFKISSIATYNDSVYTLVPKTLKNKVHIELNREPFWFTSGRDGIGSQSKVLELDGSNLVSLPQGGFGGFYIPPTVVVKITEFIRLGEDNDTDPFPPLENVFFYKGELIANLTYPDRPFEYE